VFLFRCLDGFVRDAGRFHVELTIRPNPMVELLICVPSKVMRINSRPSDRAQAFSSRVDKQWI
jgi:hypothetical protein